MKFTCLRSELSAAVSNVQRAVSAKASIPALEGILIKAYGSKLVFSGYDLEIGITTTMDATINEEGEIVVSAKLFSDIVRKLPEEIVCIETDERLITYITSGQADYQIIGISSHEYPELPSPPISKQFYYITFLKFIQRIRLLIQKNNVTIGYVY